MRNGIISKAKIEKNSVANFAENGHAHYAVVRRLYLTVKIIGSNFYILRAQQKYGFLPRKKSHIHQLYF